MTRVKLDEHNSNLSVWWSPSTEEWHWCLVWDDGCPYGNHMHSGMAPTKEQAKVDIQSTISWIETTFPDDEYFRGA